MFSELAADLNKIDASSLVGKRALVEGLLSSVPRESLPEIVSILAGDGGPGRTVPRGVAVSAISRASGHPRSVVEALGKSRGLPAATEQLLEKKVQTAFPRKTLTLSDALSELRLLMDPGKGRVSALRHLTNLLSACDPAPGRIIVEICTGNSRRHVSDSTLLDALGRLLGRDPGGLRKKVASLGWMVALREMGDSPSAP